MPPRIRTALLAPGERGWYLDSGHDFGKLWELEALIANGNPEAVDDALVARFEGRLTAIELSWWLRCQHEAGSCEPLSLPTAAANTSFLFRFCSPMPMACGMDLTSFHLFIKDRRLGGRAAGRPMGYRCHAGCVYGCDAESVDAGIADRREHG